MADILHVLNALKAIAIRTMYPPALTVGGAATAGDVLSIIATPLRGSPVTASYTVQATDTPALMASGLAAAISARVPLLGGLTATAVAEGISFGGVPGQWSISPSVSGAGTETLTLAATPQNGGSPVVGANILVGTGWPTANDLDLVAASSGASPQRAVISVYAPSGYWRNTTRYPREWQVLQAPVVTLKATAADGSIPTVTLEGTPGAGQNIALVIGYGGVRQGFVYPVSADDTLSTAAARLAMLVNEATPATASGPVISIPDAFDIVARVGGYGTVIMETGRQNERFELHVWAPNEALREAAAAPLRTALRFPDFLTLADGTAARIVPAGEYLIDDPERANIYRRCLQYDIEFADTITQPAPEIIIVDQSLVAGQAPPPPQTWGQDDLTWDQPDAAWDTGAVETVFTKP